MSRPETPANPDLSLRDLAEWAAGESRRIAANFSFDSPTDFVLAHAVKLGEEVGELHAEVLGALKYQRAEKAGQFSSDTLGGEIADVIVCLALLADVHDVDLTQAVSRKIEQLEARNGQGEITV